MNIEFEALQDHGLSISEKLQLSIAISMKRIADVLEKETFVSTMNNDGSTTGRGYVTMKNSNIKGKL